MKEPEETIMLIGIVGTRVHGDKLAMHKCEMEREKNSWPKK